MHGGFQNSFCQIKDFLKHFLALNMLIHLVKSNLSDKASKNVMQLFLKNR